MTSERLELTPTTKQLVPNSILGVKDESPLILSIDDPNHFKSPDFFLRFDSQKLHLSNQGSIRSFGEIKRYRNDGVNLSGDLNTRIKSIASDGTLLSNIGVSLTVSVTLQGHEFSVFAYRPEEDRFMLISGYVDQHLVPTVSKDLFWLNAMREASEEIIMVGEDGLPYRCVACRGEEVLNLAAYPSLTYDQNFFSVRTSTMPSFMRRSTITTVFLDREPIEVGFFYARQWNCGQLIFPVKLTFSELPQWLFHSEDLLDSSSDPPQLVTMLSRMNLVLVQLGNDGSLTDRFYRWQGGKLKPFRIDPAKTWLSEAFALGIDSDFDWVVQTDRILLADFLNVNSQ
jgi:hypothetical protein